MKSWKGWWPRWKSFGTPAEPERPSPAAPAEDDSPAEPLEAELIQTERQLETLREKRQVPVIWLLGKAQSGKSSIVRALTGNSRAEIGQGFRPCTRTASLYSFPDDDEPLVRFLDTRGLGEAHYDPQADLAAFQQAAHLLMVVVKAMDAALEPVAAAARAIRRARPDWPVMVVQTSLHEGYSSQSDPHVMPWPYAAEPWPPEVPEDLGRALSYQRALFRRERIAERFVAVDLTLPEDGYDPALYGIEPLWAAIEEVLPWGLHAMLQASAADWRDARYARAHPLIVSHALAAAAAAAFPVPFVELPLILAIQFRLGSRLARIYDQPFDRKLVMQLAGALGLSQLGRAGGRELLKVIPGVGSTLAGLATAATTYGLGAVVCAWLARRGEGRVPTQDEIRAIYAESFAEGRRVLEEWLRRSTESGRRE